jgi:hypothetical protein
MGSPVRYRRAAVAAIKPCQRMPSRRAFAVTRLARESMMARREGDFIYPRSARPLPSISPRRRHQDRCGRGRAACFEQGVAASDIIVGLGVVQRVSPASRLRGRTRTRCRAALADPMPCSGYLCLMNRRSSAMKTTSLTTTGSVRPGAPATRANFRDGWVLIDRQVDHLPQQTIRRPLDIANFNDHFRHRAKRQR